ncbi:hypothetical protein DFQ26_000168 [Actinomortierella ambigua]|nr:hypothetical protein DFQ26_000168 [Actinomortierella ambigua]
MHSPFGISDLRWLISSHLDGKDLKTCALVCKTWHRDFQPQVWRTLHTPHKDEEASGLVAWRTSAKNNAHWIRHIVDSAWSKGGLGDQLHFLLDHCRTLMSMSIRIRSKADMDLYTQLIKLNPGLQEIDLFQHSQAVPFPEESQWLDALAGHHQLRRLKLKWSFPLSHLYRILDTCPSLRELTVLKVESAQVELQQRPLDGQAQGEEQDAEALTTTTTIKAARSWRPYGLLHLSVDRWCRHPGLGELLSRTPALESLSLTNVSQTSCKELIEIIQSGGLPRLADLTLHSPTVMSDVLESFPVGQLRSVDLHEPDKRSLGLLLERQSQSLERLRLSSIEDYPLLARVIFECRRVKELAVYGNAEFEFLEIRDLLHKPWVCMDLEVLSVPIGVRRRKADHQQNVPSVLAKALADRAATTATQPDACPEWKVAEGLFMERLRQLKRLHEVDFRYLRSCYVLSYAAQIDAGVQNPLMPDQAPGDEYDRDDDHDDDGEDRTALYQRWVY